MCWENSDNLTHDEIRCSRLKHGVPPRASSGLGRFKGGNVRCATSEGPYPRTWAAGNGSGEDVEIFTRPSSRKDGASGADPVPLAKILYFFLSRRERAVGCSSAARPSHGVRPCLRVRHAWYGQIEDGGCGDGASDLLPAGSAPEGPLGVPRGRHSPSCAHVPPVPKLGLRNLSQRWKQLPRRCTFIWFCRCSKSPMLWALQAGQQLRSRRKSVDAPLPLGPDKGPEERRIHAE